MPDWFASILTIIVSVIGGLGVLGKFAMDFIKSERLESSKLTLAFIEQLKKQGADCTEERVEMHRNAEKNQERMFQVMLQFNDSLREHTEKSKDNYRASEDLLKSQSQVLMKLSEVIDVLNLDRSHDAGPS